RRGCGVRGRRAASCGGCRVTSARQIAANRRNARACTGPRTSSGKARASRNALRHGLTRSVRHDPQLARKIDALARTIAGREANAERREGADRIAAAEIELMRVRQARSELLARAATAPDLVRRLANLDRYERRARSRRRRAIRHFDDVTR